MAHVKISLMRRFDLYIEESLMGLFENAANRTMPFHFLLDACSGVCFMDGKEEEGHLITCINSKVKNTAFMSSAELFSPKGHLFGWMKIIFNIYIYILNRIILSV